MVLDLNGIHLVKGINTQVSVKFFRASNVRDGATPCDQARRGANSTLLADKRLQAQLA